MAGSVRSMGHLLEQQASLHGDRESIVALTSQGRTALTFAELYDRGTRLAGYLEADAGLKKGDRLAILLTNADACDFFTTVAAAYVGGFVSVPTSARLAPPEIAFQLEHSGVKLSFIAALDAVRGPVGDPAAFPP